MQASSARQLETSFAVLHGLTLSGLSYRLRASASLSKCFSTLRPELYTEDRLLFLLTHLERFPHKTAGATRAEYERMLAAALGVGIAQLGVHKRRYPAFADKLQQARPDLYLSPDEVKAVKCAGEDERWLALLKRWYRCTPGKTIAEFESNLAARCGVGGKQVYLARVRNPAFRQALLDLRPDLYGEGAKSNGRPVLSAQEALKRIKQVGPRTPGTAIHEYESNLGAQLARSGAWVARLRAKDAEVSKLLHRLRPDLYVHASGIRGPKFPLHEFLKCVETHGVTTPGATVFEYENNLARLIGRDGRRVAEVRRGNPKVAKLLAKCKPALYADWRCGRKKQGGGSS